MRILRNQKVLDKKPKQVLKSKREKNKNEFGLEHKNPQSNSKMHEILRDVSTKERAFVINYVSGVPTALG